MVEIEYNDVKISVPESWDDITLGVYEKFHKQKPVTHRERVTQTALVCGIDPELLLGWPTEVFNEVVRIAGFIFKDTNTEPTPIVDVNGTPYVVPIEDELTLGAYVDADEVQKTSDAVLSNVLAIVCRPAGEKYDHRQNDERAAMFAALPVSKVLGVLGFFLHCKQALDRHTAAYSNLRELGALLPQNIGSLLKRTGGIKLSRIWPTLRYLGLMLSLKNQLRKCLRSYNTKTIRTKPKKRKGN